MLGPMCVFDTAPPLSGQVKQGTKVFPLTGATIILHMFHPTRKIHKFGKGTVILTDAANGLFTYNWNASDTSLEGTWDTWIEIRTATGVATSISTEALEITRRVSGYSKTVGGRVCITE